MGVSGRRRMPISRLGTERSEAPDHLHAALAGLEDLAPAFDAHRLAATVEIGVAVPIGNGEVDDGAPATLDAAMALVDGPGPGRIAEVDCLKVFEDGLLIVLDGADPWSARRPSRRRAVSCCAASDGMDAPPYSIKSDDPACEF